MARKSNRRSFRKAGKTRTTNGTELEHRFSRRKYLKSGVAAATAGLATIGTTAGQSSIEFRGFHFDQIVHAVDDLGLDPTGSTQINSTIYSQTDGGDLVLFPDGDYLCGDSGLYGSTGGKPIGWVAEAAYESGAADYGYEADVTFIADHGTNGYCPDTGNGANLEFLFEGIDYDFSLNDTAQTGQCILGLRFHLAGRWEIRNCDTRGRAINWDNPGSEQQMVGCSVRDPNVTALIEHCDWQAQHDWALYTTLDGTGASGRMGVWTGEPHVGHIRINDVKISEFGNNAFYMSTTNLAEEGSVELRNSYVSNCGAGGARLPMSPNSEVVNTVFEYDETLYTGPDFTNQQSNSVANRPIVVETTGQSGYHDDGPFVIRDCDFRIRQTPYPSPPIHAYPGGRWVVVENCTFDLKDYHQTTTSPHQATSACLVQMSEARGHWGGQPKRTDPAPLEMRNCQAVVQNVTGAGESLITIADRDGSVIENCCFEAIGSSHDGVTVEVWDSSYGAFDVALSDTRLNVEGTPIVNIGGNSIATANLAYEGACDLDRPAPEPEPQMTATTTFTDGDGVPAGWTPRWASGGSEWTIDGNRGVLAFASGSNGRHALSWDDVPPSATDVEVLAKVRVPEIVTAGNHARLHLRSHGGVGFENGYYFDLRDEGFAVFKYVNGTGQALAQTGVTASDEWYWIRFRADGPALKLRHWVDGTVEPDEWQIEVTDASHSNGWVGVGSFDAEPSEWGAISVGTGGLAAPMPQPDDPGSMLDASVYAEADGTIGTAGVNAAIDDWKRGLIETEVLVDVVVAWRTGHSVT